MMAEDVNLSKQREEANKLNQEVLVLQGSLNDAQKTLDLIRKKSIDLYLELDEIRDTDNDPVVESHS